MMGFNMHINKNIRVTIDCNLILLYILFGLLIFQSGTVQAAINTSSLFFKVTRLLMVFLTVFFGVHGLCRLNLKEFRAFFYCLIVLEIIAGINYILYPNSWIELQYKILLFLLLYLTVKWSKRKSINLDEVLYNVLLFIAYITLFLYVLIELIRLPVPYSVMHEVGSTVWYKNYFNLFYSYSTAFPPRICGFFWEPGVNQIYLNLALLLYYLLKKNNKFQLFILIISILFTQSSSGYIIMFIIFTAIICKNEHMKKFNKSLIRIFLGILSVVCAMVVFFIKAKETSAIGDSFAMRSNDLITGFILFLENPIFGRGFYNTDIFAQVSYYAGGNSNGLLTVMYTTGIVGIIFLCFPFLFNLIAQPMADRKREETIVFFFILAINFTEPIYSLSIMIYLLARGRAVLIT